jgi:hypothetical protein
MWDARYGALAHVRLVEQWEAAAAARVNEGAAPVATATPRRIRRTLGVALVRAGERLASGSARSASPLPVSR